MKRHLITLTVAVDSRASERKVRELLEASLCDSAYSLRTDDGPAVAGRIVAVDAGVCPAMLKGEPYMHDGHAYPHIVEWVRA